MFKFPGSWDSTLSVVARLPTEQLWSDSWQGQNIFLLSTASRLIVGLPNVLISGYQEMKCALCHHQYVCVTVVIQWTVHIIVCFIDRASLYNVVNKANLPHNYSYYVYFFSLHVLGDYVPIIRRYNCICVTLGNCHSVWMTVSNAGWNETFSFHPVYRVTSTKCRTGTFVSPDDGHIVAQSIYRKEINLLRKLCKKLALFTRTLKQGPRLNLHILL